MGNSVPVFFHASQAEHRPLYEWAFGEKFSHPETSHRIETILEAIHGSGSLFSVQPPEKIAMERIYKVHGRKLTRLYEVAEREIAEGQTFYPSVFPREILHPGKMGRLAHTGAHCFDSGTPLTRATRAAAEWSAACAHSASLLVERGEHPFAYALCRPPGHHASRKHFGGYCYYNNAAVVASRWREKGKVAIVDIDFHHGNGTQSIFYQDPEVLFISIHGDPDAFYPYFSGFSKETGYGRGKGFTINLPLPTGTDAQEYFKVLDSKVIPAIQAFAPSYLVLSAGFDTFKEDPIGKFTLDTPDFADVGGRFARLGLPTVVLQEGGYCVDKLGVNVVSFLSGYQDALKALPSA